MKKYINETLFFVLLALMCTFFGMIIINKNVANDTNAHAVWYTAIVVASILIYREFTQDVNKMDNEIKG